MIQTDLGSPILIQITSKECTLKRHIPMLLDLSPLSRQGKAWQIKISHATQAMSLKCIDNVPVLLAEAKII